MNKKEILRYLGAQEDTKELDESIIRAQRELEAAAQLRTTSRLFPIDIEADSVTINHTEICSRDLCRHLQGCKEAFLFAMTLGPEIDRLIRRYSISELSFVPVLQACAAAYTEECADQAQKELEQLAAERGLYLRPRYSPGYGDFSLQYQHFLFSVLELPKKIGVSLTDSCLMVPFKSITAVIGLSPDPSLCHVGKCMTCNSPSCPFRKEL